MVPAPEAPQRVLASVEEEEGCRVSPQRGSERTLFCWEPLGAEGGRGGMEKVENGKRNEIREPSEGPPQHVCREVAVFWDR